MRKPPTYKDFETQFPDYIIIQKSGCFYEAYGRSAEIVSRELEYKLYKNYYGKLTAGGPDCDKIMRILRAEDYSFLIVEDNKIVDGHSGRNPFGEKVDHGDNKN